MAYNYDKLYEETPDALGEPTQIFVDFFDKLTAKNLRVLDVGCGQGRDALFIARLGHSVVGVDLSPSGIRDLKASGKKEALPIEGVVADISTYAPEGDFDIVLIDRTLHMLPEEPRLETLQRLIDHVVTGGWVLIADEKSNFPGFRAVFEKHSADWVTELDARGNLFHQRK